MIKSSGPPWEIKELVGCSTWSPVQILPRKVWLLMKSRRLHRSIESAISSYILSTTCVRDLNCFCRTVSMGMVHFKFQFSAPEIHPGLVQERWFLPNSWGTFCKAVQEVPQLHVWAAPIAQGWLATGQWLRINSD